MSETRATLTIRTVPGRGVIVSRDGDLSKRERLDSEQFGRHSTAATLKKVAEDVEIGSLYVGEPA